MCDALIRYDPSVERAVGDSAHGDFNTTQVWVGYNFLLAFLLTFRSGRAFARWWEGGTLLQQARGEWFNSFSSLIAFSTSDAKRWKEVKSFQQILATLMSMLFCSALNSVAEHPFNYEVLNLVDMREDSSEFLRHSTDKCEVLLLWIQRLVVENMESGATAFLQSCLPVRCRTVGCSCQHLRAGPLARICTCQISSSACFSLRWNDI